jgi:ergothioneine biosynthesis protein EgtB
MTEAGSDDRVAKLTQRFLATRLHSVELCRPLANEDYVPQPIADVSPPKWHLGHTSWFFEAVVLSAHASSHRPFHPQFGFLFNSYYESQGERVMRHKRGDLSRPTVAEILSYREHVNRAIVELISNAPSSEAVALIELGIEHEQQHQELLLTDIKYILAVNPLQPAYLASSNATVDVDSEFAHQAATGQWLSSDGGLVQIGAEIDFSFDNERPRHRTWLEPFALRASLVTQREYLEFIDDGGYKNANLWLSEGWDWANQNNHAPLYWLYSDGQWQQYTLQGVKPVAVDAPITHINFFEAAAFCQWAGWRLPREAEWESLASRFTWGRRWEWTQSAYAPYPGFVPSGGVVAEYNGKFMVNQMVLRGASFATPAGHSRATYRNFFHPQLRWQYTGLRPAKDIA